MGFVPPQHQEFAAKNHGRGYWSSEVEAKRGAGAPGRHPPFPASPPCTGHFGIALQSPVTHTLPRSLAPSLLQALTALGFGVLEHRLHILLATDSPVIP